MTYFKAPSLHITNNLLEANSTVYAAVYVRNSAVYIKLSTDTPVKVTGVEEITEEEFNAAVSA